MASTAAARTYKAALDAIYKSQVFGEELRRAYSERKGTVEAMRIYMRRLGLLHEGQNPSGPAADLRVVHVTGTKGKGSTCAYVDSILRAHGASTVLFTSPHLVRLNERIRVNGRPISDEALATHFWDLWDRLQQAQVPADEPPPVPGFFRLLTLLGFWVAVREKVDALVLEVGVGGRYDATNVLPGALACVVNSLDLDHTELLGNTIDQVAWEKGGIIKPGVPCFVAPQAKGGLSVLQDCAKEVHAPLYLVEPLKEAEMEERGIRLGIGGEAQRINAALAVAVAHTYLHHTQQGTQGGGETGLAAALQGLASPDKGLPWLDVTPEIHRQPLTRQGLETCTWPGRCQRVEWPERPNVRVMLDGAHTEQSMAQAVRWLDAEYQRDQDARGKDKRGDGRRRRALVFNCSAEKNVPELLRHLVVLPVAPVSLRFDRVVLCPASAMRPSLASIRSPPDILAAAAATEGLDLPRLLRICEHLDGRSDPSTGQEEGTPPLPWQQSLRGVWLALATYHQLGSTEAGEEEKAKIASLLASMEEHVVVRPSVQAALDDVCSIEGAQGRHVDVFVTGSLYVVGDALAGIQPP